MGRVARSSIISIRNQLEKKSMNACSLVTYLYQLYMLMVVKVVVLYPFVVVL